MSLWISRYNLEPFQNKAFHISTEGVLIKIEKASGEEAYSLYHPILSLKDRPLSDFVRKLSLDSEDVLVKKVLTAACSVQDFKPLLGSRVKNYFSAPSLSLFLKKQDFIWDQGYRAVKFKIKSSSDLLEICSHLESLKFKCILDFGGKGSAEQIVSFFSSRKSFADKILYLEDPCILEEEGLTLPVASDFIDYKNSEISILKPTGFNHSLKMRAVNVVTSYLDHPWGQMVAARYALKNKCADLCGLRSDIYFKKNKYSELFSNGSEIDFRRALDFVKLLEKENWEKIK